MIDPTIVLEGYGVRLEPLEERHLPALRADCHDPALWELTFSDSPFGDDAGAKAWLQASLEDPKMHAFAIVDASTGATIGSTRYLDIEPAHRKLEIGWTFLAPRYWRSHVNTACKLLLMEYAFEKCGALRMQFKAEAKNWRSRRALEGIGATCEGVLRNFRIRPDGEIRDTSFYSVIVQEWPAVRARLEQRLNARSGAESRV
ncbi:MAG TPA: GNAT family N-acetyltransferase [Candidatus Acidoferrales bacterium]|nr:GNAT family N-acetyltransferase [Candidatus Acidoferrales bacterium]